MFALYMFIATVSWFYVAHHIYLIVRERQIRNKVRERKLRRQGK